MSLEDLARRAHERKMKYKTKTFEINTVGRDFFLGDLHGMHDLFFAELRRVDFDFDKDRVFSVGDLADRGPNPVESLMLLKNPWFHAVLGNHEDFLLGSHGDRIWMDERNGGEWAYGKDISELRELVEEKCWNTMTVNTRFGTVGVVHAESARTWQDNSMAHRENNLWARKRIYSPPGDKIRGVDMVVVGHTPLKEVVRIANILYIDTGGCFADGFLTLLSAEEVFTNDFKEFK